MSRFCFGRRLALAAACLGLAGCLGPDAERKRLAADVIIAGGTVHDGTGARGRFADLVIVGGTIRYIGPSGAARFEAKRRIDADGLVVSPGFIDPHTHAGSDLASDDAQRRANLPFAFQGVTTVVVGNDGGGSPEISKLAAKATEQGIGTNIAYLVGFGPLRRAAMGTENRPASSSEVSQMRATARQAMCQGAWGFSTGLYYVPQSYAPTDEVVELASVAGSLGGYYDTHMRDESTYNVTVQGALSEALEIGRRADIPVHIAHIKALGPAVWGHSGKMIEAVEAARKVGQRVTADQYPWEASGTRVSNALVPRWALEGGLAGLRERLDNEAAASRIREGMVEGLERRGGADKLLVTGRLGSAEVAVGKTLADIADAQGLKPVDAAIAILKDGDARVASFNMSEADIAAFAGRDWVVTGSDGSSGHPRKYGSFPKAYRDLVKGEARMPLARFIRRSSGQTADIIGLRGRGYLKQGYAADVLVFDPERFAPRATYQTPREYSAGVVHLLVNGEVVISSGEYVGTLPGEPLLKETECSD